MSHAFSKTSKDILARAMAQEDIIVEHSKSIETACFDVKQRRLILPIWKDMDSATYDMLVGHEVSHALHTPADGWTNWVGSGPRSTVRHMFLNVVEDARIERMIKDKFPGLRRDFSSAYKSFHERDIFGIAGKDVSKLSLIDRLNLYFKIGLFGLVTVPFSADEKQYVTRMAETKTFDDVAELAKELYELWQSENPEELEEPEPNPNFPDIDFDEHEDYPEGEEGEEGEEDGAGDGSGDDEEGDEDGPNGQKPSGSSDSEEGDESSPAAGGEDSGESMEDDTDDGESADGETKSSEGGSETAGEEPLSYDDYSNEPGLPGSTQNAMEKGVSDFRDDTARDTAYFELPTANLENIVIDFKTLGDIWTDEEKNLRWKNDAEIREKRRQHLREYRNSIKGTVAQMVQQFQMKQAADADKKTEIAKTGVLDTVGMINYRWSEDIFMKNEVHPDGKNHGMIIYLDWSGSMNEILDDTLEQLLVLVEFCRKVNIPYEVYAFSSNTALRLHGMTDEEIISARDSDENDQWNVKENNREGVVNDEWNQVSPHDFLLINFLSSRMNRRQFEEGLTNLWYLRVGEPYDYSGYLHSIPRGLSLGCTPLNEAILCAMQQVPEFRDANGIQIVNTVFLTDGCGHGMLPYTGNTTFIRDSKSRKTYQIGRRNETDALLEMLRDKTGTNLVGIRLHNGSNVNNIRWQLDGDNERMNREYKKNNFTTLDSAYDEYFIVKGNLKVETDSMEELGDNESYTKIKNAFMKGGNRKKSSRVIATRMVEIFAH